MKSIFSFLLGFLITIMLFNCRNTKPNYSKIGGVSSEPGWLIFNYPRTTWGPGYVFRIKEGDNVPQQVTTLRAKRSLDTGYVFLPGEERQRSFAGNAFLRFLFLNPKDTTLKAKVASKIDLDLNIGQAFSESIDEPLIDSLVKNSNIFWRDNNKYYIVQETLSTKKISYKNLTNGNMSFNTILNFKAVNSAGKITKDSKDSTYLNQDFDRYYRVYYKAIEITPTGAASSNTKHYSYTKVTHIDIKD